MLAVLLCQELVIGLLIYNVYQNMSNNLNERNSLTFSVIFFSIDGIPEKTFSSFPSKASTLSSYFELHFLVPIENQNQEFHIIRKLRRFDLFK